MSIYINPRKDGWYEVCETLNQDKVKVHHTTENFVNALMVMTELQNVAAQQSNA